MLFTEKENKVRNVGKSKRSTHNFGLKNKHLAFLMQMEAFVQIAHYEKVIVTPYLWLT